MLVEAGDTLLDRASRVNQARIHTGFHYPRSALTAVKSMALHRRFVADFAEAVTDDFQMLYAIARRRSKVCAKRFYRMFRDIGAPIMAASSPQSALFDNRHIESVFACSEAAFNYKILRRMLMDRLDQEGVSLQLCTSVEALRDSDDDTVATMSDGSEIQARYVFNITYSEINNVLASSRLPQAKLKHELTELALIEPPEELRGIGVTVMDGPFFSCMPYPAEQLYSLTHVRYTPHESWIDNDGLGRPSSHLASHQPITRVHHMIKDSQRYMPCLERAIYRRSIYEVKTLLLKNEQDDARPILIHRKPEDSRVISILGGKIDNIYDLFDFVRQFSPELKGAHAQHLVGTRC